MSQPTTDAEWRQLILAELRDLRKDFQSFKTEVIKETSEGRGRRHIITGLVSFLVSALFAVLHKIALVK